MTNEQSQQLRTFALRILENWPVCGLDGGDLQDIAIECGLLQEFAPTEPCGEECDCSFVAGFPTTCYRRAAWLTEGAA